jgi:hypothetical protein
MQGNTTGATGAGVTSAGAVRDENGNKPTGAGGNGRKSRGNGWEQE